MSERNTSEIEEILNKKLIELAKKIPGTEAVYKGNDTKEPSMTVYYLLIPGIVNANITDSITEAEISLSRKFPNLDFSLMRWPISLNEAKKYSFLGKCIHQFQP